MTVFLSRVGFERTLNSMKIKIISQILYLFIRLLNFTYRYQYIGKENKALAKSKSPAGSFIFACWHQNLIGTMLSHSTGEESYTMIVSESKDGELVAVTCEKFGHKPVRGSSTRGGKKAVLEIVKKLKSGLPGAITVDGPKGPSKVVKPGIVEIARLAKVPIVPLSAYPTNFWTFAKSWDQFRVPKPFSRIVIVIGEPIVVDETITRDHFDSILVQVAEKICDGETIAINAIHPQVSSGN